MSTTRGAGDGAGGPGRVLLHVWVQAEDREYLDRRASADAGGDRAAALRRVIAEARTLRHDLRGKLAALDLIETCLATGAMTQQELAPLIAEIRREMRAMIDGIEAAQ
jgi:hypothetical protein